MKQKNSINSTKKKTTKERKKTKQAYLIVLNFKVYKTMNYMFKKKSKFTIDNSEWVNYPWILISDL